VAQYLGAFLGASVVYGIYYNAIMELGGGKTADTRGIFASYPTDANITSNTTLAFDQVAIIQNSEKF
jgi:glycerol uptake facilitator-like aquaporin